MLELVQESLVDYLEVEQVVEKAFENEEISDHKEHLLVRHLRESDAFIPELSIVAKRDEKIVGHILLTRIAIFNSDNEFESLALAPVSVLPSYQRKGLGGKLILEAHSRAKALGYKSIILLGHADYYPRFGYKKASLFDISIPFEVADENCMAIELVEGGLDGVHGMVKYPKEFLE